MDFTTELQYSSSKINFSTLFSFKILKKNRWGKCLGLERNNFIMSTGENTEFTAQYRLAIIDSLLFVAMTREKRKEQLFHERVKVRVYVIRGV